MYDPNENVPATIFKPKVNDIIPEEQDESDDGDATP